MQSRQPWRLICSGALMTLGGLSMMIMAHAQYHSLPFGFAVIVFLAGLGWLVFEILRMRKNMVSATARSSTSKLRPKAEA